MKGDIKNLTDRMSLQKIFQRLLRSNNKNTFLKKKLIIMKI